MSGDDLCCDHSADRTHPHYAGALSELMAVAEQVGLTVEDLRGASSLAALRRMYWDAGSRYFSSKAVNLSDVRVLVVDDSVFADPATCAVVIDIVSQVRWQGLCLWIDADGAMPREVAVQLTRAHCNACTVRGLSDALMAGCIL